jgi:hypothetical protein
MFGVAAIAVMLAGLALLPSRHGWWAGMVLVMASLVLAAVAMARLD